MSNYQAEAPLGTQIGQATIAGHPPGLYILFFTEMWERFSYYGMRALLVLYIVNHLSKPEVAAGVLGFTALRGGLEGVFGPLSVQALASQIYGLYTAFVFLTPFFGGLLADRVLGQRKTVIIGGTLMAIGHFLMAFESLFFPALLFIIFGNGAFKPNISTQVGLLYPQGDPRRDRAFSIFYVGINLGAFFAPLVCGTLGQVYGWHYGFSAAGIGMVAGLIFYILLGPKYLPSDNLARAKAEHRENIPLTREEWGRIGALGALFILVIFFWAVYEQQGNTIALWADQNTDRNLFGNGWLFPSSWVQSINPFLIFTLTPVLTTLWARQSRQGKEPDTVTKMAIGCLFLGIGFLFLVGAANNLSPSGQSSVLWLLGFFFFLTVGELHLSPVGLSMVTKVAPAKIVSMMMGAWFLANFAGNYLAGYLGSFWEKMPKGGFFLLMAGIAITAAVAIWSFSRPLKNVMGAGADAGKHA